MQLNFIFSPEITDQLNDIKKELMHIIITYN